MIKFTMGSSSDAKKTPRRKPKRPTPAPVAVAPSSAAVPPKNNYLLGSNPGVTSAGSSTLQGASVVGQTNGCFQTTSPSSTSSSTSLNNTRIPVSDSPSIPSYSQPRHQEVRSMQTSSGQKRGGESPNHMPSTKFYLNGDGCFFCRHAKIGNAEVNLHHFIESASGADLSSLPQLWVCREHQQTLDRSGINSVSADLNEEIVLDSPLSPTDGGVSQLSSSESNNCNCFSCAETRQIKEQNETFEQELQQYLYKDLCRLAAFVYQTSLSAMTADAYEEYQLSVNNTKKLHNLMQKIYCRNPQHLFRCLESWATTLIMERRSALCEQLPPTFQQLTVSMASQLITSLLDEYSCFCIVCQNLMSFFDSQENAMLKEFRLTLELHHKYRFHQLIFAPLQKYLTSAVTLISMQMMKLRKENAAAVNPHSQLLQKHSKFQEEMSRVRSHWTDYYQLAESRKDEKKLWQGSQKPANAKTCEIKTVPSVQNDGNESYAMNRMWHIPEQTDSNVDAYFPGYNEFRNCKCDAEKVRVDSANASKVAAFPSHLLQSGGSQIIPFKNTSPSSSKRSGSSSSECSSRDDNCDTCQILESFIQKSCELANDGVELRSKGIRNEEDDDEDDVEEHDGVTGDSRRLVVSLCDHLNASDSNSVGDDDDDDDDDDDEDDDERDDIVKSREMKGGVKDGVFLSNSTLSLVSDSSIPAATNEMPFCAAVSEALTGSSASASAAAAAASVANGELFVFGERPDTTQVTIVQPTLQPQCQCSSCIGGAISADLPRQSLIPPLSSLNIYPHLHSTTLSNLQQKQELNDANITRSRQPHAFRLHGQHGDDIEQLALKAASLESNADVFPKRNLLPDWDLQSSFFFKPDNNYGKLVLASNGGPPLTALSLVSGATETQTILDDGNVWFKVDQPNTAAHSAILPQNGITALSPSLFKINTNDMHHSQSSIFPLSMPDTCAGVKGRVDQQPQYCFHQPVAVTCASNVFNISSSLYQNTSSSAMFVQAPTFGTSTLYDLSSCMKLPGELVNNTSANDSPLCGTGTDSTVANGKFANASVANIGPGVVPSGSVDNAVAGSNNRASLCTSSGFSEVVPNMYMMLPETMEQFNISQSAAVDSDHANCAATMGNHVPLSYHHSLPLQRPGSGSQPSGCNEDQQSLTSCKTDSQQDEDEYNSQDESGSSSSNLKDGKFCDCWHCEVFGRSTPATLPTSKNYPEMRDRLRLRLKKKKSELECSEDMDTMVPVMLKTSDHSSSDMKDIEEVMKFINGDEDEDDDEKSRKDELIKSKNKAAKRSRQKLRKQQQKQQKTKQPGKSEMSECSHISQCDSNKKVHAMPSHCMSNSHTRDCCRSHATSSNSSHHGRSDSNCSKKASSDAENMTLLNMLNAMKLNEKSVSSVDKSTADVARMQMNCNGSKTGRFKVLERNEANHAFPSNSPQINGTLAADMVKNGMVKQSASLSSVLRKDEIVHAKKIKASESLFSIQNAVGSEPKEDFRIEGEMKPVTISSEDGVRTILASPLLQAELAKNKPLQKLFMQAVQQQQQSREKQEASMRAETEFRHHSANQQNVSTATDLQSKTAKASKQLPNTAGPNSACGARPCAVTAGSISAAPEQKMAQSNDSKMMHHLLRNGTTANRMCTPKIHQNGCQATGTSPHCQSKIQSGVVARDKAQLNRAQPYTIPDEKLQEHPDQSSVTTALRKTSQQNNKAGKTLNVVHATSDLAQCRHQDQCRKEHLPSSGILSANKMHPQMCNGFSSHVATSVASANSSPTKSEAAVTSPSVPKILSRQANRKPGNVKKNRKSVLPTALNEQLVGVCSEDSGDIAKKVNSTATDANFSEEVKVQMNGTPEKQVLTLTSPSSADSAELCGSEVKESCVSSKAKKNKKKSKARGSLASVDEIFLPKNVPDDCHLDEHEREIEEFKRFCSNSAPSGTRQKVNLNNVKDMFNKKKVISAGYQ